MAIGDNDLSRTVQQSKIEMREASFPGENAYKINWRLPCLVHFGAKFYGKSPRAIGAFLVMWGRSLRVKLIFFSITQHVY